MRISDWSSDVCSSDLFAQAYLTPAFRVRAEGRKGLSGHKGWVGEISADYVAREGDDWLFSIGPRVTLGDAKYHRAYFGVTPAAATTSGLPAYDPGGGVPSVGVTAGYHRMLGRRSEEHTSELQSLMRISY